MEVLCIDFMNSEWHDPLGSGRSEDRLQQPGWLAHFLVQWQLEVEEPATASEITLLLTLRALLRHMTRQASQGEKMNAKDMALLDDYLRAASLQWCLLGKETPEGTICQLHLEPLRRDWKWVYTQISASFVECISKQEPSRLRMCANEDCQWIFYDQSRAGRRRWCEGRACGNLMAVRRFRARHQNPPAEDQQPMML